MKRKSTSPENLPVKLRYKLIGAWLGIEMLTAAFALPAFATFSERISFSVEQIVVVQELEQSAGRAQFLIASNAPFGVISEGIIADMQITVTQSGVAAGNNFGSKAQLPGVTSKCSAPTSTRASRIYTSQDKTAARRGNPQEQSVLLEITYPKELSAQFRIVTMDKLKEQHALLAHNCSSPLS